jgi:decaprenylphospho-beta-D-erythro-pentofuranosid-2-ulose 2-reductase
MKDALGRVRRVLVLGGGSDIGLATAQAYVRGGARHVILAARKPNDLAAAAATLRELGATTVETIAFDSDAFDTHEDVLEAAFTAGDIDVIVLAFGVLSDQPTAERDPAHALDTIRTNFSGAVSVLLPLADRLTAQGHGSIVVISSAAGQRGRRSNYVYGSSKAGLDVFCQGLGDRLAPLGVQVLIVRPGFVRSKMTQGLPSAPLATTPQAVAQAIVTGTSTGASIVWVPGAMRWVMAGLRLLPPFLFRRLEI